MQVMELLKEVAKDRLVVMVTHNPELAEKYATRIVKLRDGRIIDDSDTYEIEKTELKEPQHRNMGKSSMSFKTALSLSFNNLRTKKARTLLTSFAGSIGIIGIALILAISTGVNTYISDLQKSTMTSYPISIEAQSMDLSSMLAAGRDNTDSAGEGADHEKDAVYSDGSSIEMASSITTSITENNLTKFKEYLESDDCDITQYVGENGIAYSYDTAFSVYAHDPDGILVNTDGSTLDDSSSKGAGGMNMMSGMSSMMSSGSNNFEELMPGTEGNLISDAITDNYELLYGEWANSYDEVVLVLDKNNEISSTALYELGILPSSEYKEILQKIEDGQEVALDTRQWSYEEICSQELYMIPACDLYQENENGLFEKIGDTDSEIESLLSSAIKLKITGIIRPAEDAENALISESIGYTSALTEYLIDYTNNSAVVQAQQASPDNNVLNGAEFSPADDAAKIADTKNYLNRLSDKEKADMCREILQSAYSDDPNNAQMMQNMTDAQLSATLDRYVLGSGDTENERLLSIYDTYISSGSYDDNMTAFGYVSPDAPAGINIYVDSFEDKEAITDCIDDYNKTVAEEDQISYTDYVGLLMSSVTTIVNVISYVLIAFVAVSLVVSSIMIGIITYISVLERTKEIGILRAIGASKRNISQVFNAETFIVGLCSGLIGIGITLLLLIPGNAIIHSLTGAADINAVLPIGSAVLLIVLSVILTLIGGFIPSKKAAKKDPVAALRAE